MERSLTTKKKGRVLAVDDCAVMRAILCSALEPLGYSVQAVAVGAAALQAAAQSDFDAIILDVELPDMDGMAVGRALRLDPRTASVKIAMHTSMAEDRVRAGFSDYDSFLPKSLDPQRLRQQLERLMLSRPPA
jgi:CheY-like chemotaxis protein